VVAAADTIGTVRARLLDDEAADFDGHDPHGAFRVDGEHVLPALRNG
jgi:hypothetical protein